MPCPTCRALHVVPYMPCPTCRALLHFPAGLDIDGRRELIQSMIPRIENGMRRCIMFIKQLPGFRLLPVDDQISLIKSKSRIPIFSIQALEDN